MKVFEVFFPNKHLVFDEDEYEFMGESETKLMFKNKKCKCIYVLNKSNIEYVTSSEIEE